MTDLAETVETGGGSPLDQQAVLRGITEKSEAIRLATLAMTALVDERNDLIREAIDRYLVSHRQAARAAGLSAGRIHGILAND